MVEIKDKDIVYSTDKSFARNKGINLDIGKVYSLDVIGEKKVKGDWIRYELPFGVINKTNVLVHNGWSLDIGDRGEDIEFQPGDRVDIRITKIEGNQAYALATQNKGCFLGELFEKQKDFKIKLTNQSNKNITDAISEPRWGEGLNGIFTVIKNAKYLGDKEKYGIRVINYIKNKDGRYLIIAEANDEVINRDLDSEIFLKLWNKTSWGRDERGDYRKIEVEPNMVNLPENITEISPRNFPGIALYFKNEKERWIIFNKQNKNISHLSPEKAVKEFSDRCRKGTLKIGLAKPDVKGQLEEAVKSSGLKVDYFNKFSWDNNW